MQKTNNIEIKRVRLGDQALFESIADEVFDEAIVPERLNTYLAEPNHHMILAFQGTEVVGQVAVVVHRHPDKPTELYIDEVGVTPRLRRQGIARRMLDEAFVLGKELGCEEAWLGTTLDNVAARGLYESYGEAPEPIVMYSFDL